MGKTVPIVDDHSSFRASARRVLDALADALEEPTVELTQWTTISCG